jgi:hypothetical protein
VKVLTEIGSDDFGQLETRSPKIKTAPQAANLNPTAVFAPEIPSNKSLNQKQLQKLAARQLSFSPPASRLTNSPHDFWDFQLKKSSRTRTQNFTSDEMGDRPLLTQD